MLNIPHLEVFLELAGSEPADTFSKREGGDADPVGVGPITVRPPTAIAPGATRPVEIVVGTMSRDVRLPGGQLVRFWLDYGSGETSDRCLWAVAQYNANGGWANIGSDNRSLSEPGRALLRSAPPPAQA